MFIVQAMLPIPVCDWESIAVSEFYAKIIAAVDGLYRFINLYLPSGMQETPV